MKNKAKTQYKVIRLYADKKWHIEAEHLTYRRALNLSSRLYQSVMGISPNDIRIVSECDIFTLITEAVNEASCHG